jgi:hypothetical protein
MIRPSILAIVVASCFAGPAVGQLVLYGEFSSTRELSELTTFLDGEDITLVMMTHDEDFDSDPTDFAQLEIPITAADDGKTFVWKGNRSPLVNWFGLQSAGGGAVWVYRPLNVWVLNEEEVDAACSSSPDPLFCEYEIRNRLVAPDIGPTVTEASKLFTHFCQSGEPDDPCIGQPFTEIHTTLEMLDAGNGRTAVAFDVAVNRNFVPEPSSVFVGLVALLCIGVRHRPPCSPDV